MLQTPVGHWRWRGSRFLTGGVELDSRRDHRTQMAGLPFI
jgi:hypothetical protein